MTGPFGPAELDGADEPLTVVDQAEAFRTARELEAAAMAADVRPSAGFSTRVMAAVAAEPLPGPVTALGWAARRGRLRAAAAALADAWRLAWSGGRPLAARAQALAVVVVLVLTAASVSGLAVAGVAGMLRQPSVTVPSPTEMMPSVAPSDEMSSPSPTPPDDASATPDPKEIAEPTATPKRSSPRPTAHPTETPEGRDDHDGDDGSGSEGSSEGGE
jgi:hypothetical protein